MRILDCKDDSCKQMVVNAPALLDHICEDCAKHFERVKSKLTAMDIPFSIDKGIVRGLDYYTRTVLSLYLKISGHKYGMRRRQIRWFD